MAIQINVVGQANTKDLERARRELEQLSRSTQTGTARMAAGFEKAGGAMVAAGASMSRAGRTMTRNVTLPIVAIGGMAVKSFADFDKAMVESQAIMGDLSDAMKNEMSEAAREVARTTTHSAAEAAESFYFLASAGLDAQQSIAALPQVAAFAQAGAFDMARATDLATDSQSALGLASKDAAENLANMTRVTDVFTRAGQLANASVEQFATAITTKAGVAMNELGIEIEEGVAVLAAFADAGVKGEAAGTMFASTLEGLTRNAINNADAFEALDVAVFDADGNMRGMRDIVAGLEHAFDGMSAEQRKAELMAMGFNKQALAGITLLLGNADALHEYEQALGDAGGAVDEVAAKQLESFSNQMKLLKDQLIDVAIDIGPIIIEDFLKPFMEWVAKGVEWLKQLTPEQRKMAVRLALIAAAAGPVLKIVGLLVGGLGRLVIGIGKAIKIFGILSKVLMANPWILLIAGIIALVVLVVKNWDKIKAVVLAAWTFIKTVTLAVWGAIADWIRGVWERIVAAATSAWQGVVDAVSGPLGVIRKVVEVVFGVIQAVITGVMWVIQAVVAVAVHAVWQTVKGVFEQTRKVVEIVWGAISKAISVAWDAIVRVTKPPLDWLSTRITAVLTIIRAVWERVWSTISGFVSRTWNTISGVVGGAVSAVRDTIGRALDVISSKWSTIWESMTSTLSRIWEGFKGIVRSALNAIIDLVNKGIRALNKIKVTMPDIPGFPGRGKTYGVSIPEIPNLALGGIVMPRPGGVLARLAEAGRPEAVVPLDRAGSFGGVTVAAGAIQIDVDARGASRDDIPEIERAARRAADAAIARLVREIGVS